MLMLSLDTTSRAGSCALVRDVRVLREQASDASRDQAERLPGELAALLDRESVALEEIDCFAVATGPGSFTGLRVGIATMQGLAMATGRPLIGVSACDALAMIGGSGGVLEPDPPYVRGAGAAQRTRRERIATWIDAWRGEVFAALYEDGRERDALTVARPKDLLARQMGLVTVFTGDGAAQHRELIRATLGDAARFTAPVAPLLAGVIAALAGEAFRAGQRPPPHAIRPIYVRRSAAEPARGAGRGVHVWADPKGPFSTS
ncbi:MAG: peptidase glycoprotease [Acidobacteria bacterium]|nr:peptidase glycoprotease [Acidobacteriota bacterium]